MSSNLVFNTKGGGTGSNPVGSTSCADKWVITEQNFDVKFISLGARSPKLFLDSLIYQRQIQQSYLIKTLIFGFKKCFIILPCLYVREDKWLSHSPHKA